MSPRSPVRETYLVCESITSSVGYAYPAIGAHSAAEKWGGDCLDKGESRACLVSRVALPAAPLLRIQVVCEEAPKPFIGRRLRALGSAVLHLRKLPPVRGTYVVSNPVNAGTWTYEDTTMVRAIQSAQQEHPEVRDYTLYVEEVSS